MITRALSEQEMTLMVGGRSYNLSVLNFFLSLIPKYRKGRSFFNFAWNSCVILRLIKKAEKSVFAFSAYSLFEQTQKLCSHRSRTHLSRRDAGILLFPGTAVPRTGRQPSEPGWNFSNFICTLAANVSRKLFIPGCVRSIVRGLYRTYVHTFLRYVSECTVRWLDRSFIPLADPFFLRG